MLVTCQPPIGRAIGTMTAWTLGFSCRSLFACVTSTCDLFAPWVASACAVARDWPFDCSVACGPFCPNTPGTPMFHVTSPLSQKPIQSNKTFLSQAACSFKQGNKGRLKTFLLTVSNYSQLLQRSALTNYCIDLLADKVHWIKHKSLQCYISHIPIRK